MWDSYFDMNAVSEIRLKTTVFMGPGAIAKIDFIASIIRRYVPNVKFGDMFGWQLYNGQSLDIKMTYDAQEINGEQKVICILDYPVKLDDRNFMGAF